jgi:ADP-heptose:LPS heptosyltransferase
VDQIPPVNNRYDIYYNLDDAYEYNPYTNYVDNYFYRVFGDKECNKEVELFPTEEDKLLVEQDAVSMDMPYVVIHMRNWHWQAKNIELGVWFEIFEKVFTERSDFMFVCVGNKQDHFVEGHPNFFDARDRYNSQQLKHLCDHANAFVGIDSGPFQCAAASSTRIIGLLTHLLPERIMPYRKWEFNHNAVAIQTSEDCAGCNDEQIRPIMQIFCKKGDFPCTRNFDTDLVAQEILKTL